MAYEKLLNEIYAAVSLKYLWPEYQPTFKKSGFWYGSQPGFDAGRREN